MDGRKVNRVRHPVLPVVVALVAALAAGCAAGPGSESGKPAEQILGDARTAAETADSVHISGTVLRGGTPAQIDMLLTSGGDGREHIAAGGQAIDLVKVGQTLYVKGVPVPGPSVGGWTRLSAQDSGAARLAQQVDMHTVFDQLVRVGDAPNVTGSTTVSGQPAIKIAPKTGTGVLLVADDADHPYPLQVLTTAPASATGDAPRGSLAFTGWNAHTVITPPPGSGS